MLKKNFKSKLSLLVLASTLLLSACSNDTPAPSAEVSAPAESAAAVSAEPSAEQEVAVESAENLSTFVTNLQSDYIVQEGRFEDVDTLAMASAGQLTSCFGNNNGSFYQTAYLPPAPEQNFATGIPQLNWADEAPTAFDDPEVENYPANPYFAPIGWTYKLRADEAIVLLYELPPESEYFSIGAYALLAGAQEGMDLSYDPYNINLKGTEEIGEYNVVFSSLGDQLNQMRIESTAAEGEAHFGEKAVIVIGGDQSTNEDMVAQLIESGISESVINVINLPSQALNMGLQTGGDTFTLLGRVSQPTGGEEAYQEFAAKLLSDAEIYRITPMVEDEAVTMPLDQLVRRGTGISEMSTLGYSRQDLDSIRQSIIDKYTAEGYSYIELYPHISVPDGITSIYATLNGKGDNRDAAYLSTDYFQFNSPDDLVVMYGVNHTETGKATYSNSVLYGVDKLNGVASAYDAQYVGSADAYLAEGYHDSENYYVYNFDRYGTEPYSTQVEYSTDNEKGKYYGVDDGQDLRIAFRAYVEPETGVGPAYDEIVYDRAILFYKEAE